MRYAGTGIVVSGQQASLSVSASQINSNAGYGIVGSQNAGPLQLTVTNSTFNANGSNTAIHVACSMPECAEQRRGRRHRQQLHRQRRLSPAALHENSTGVVTPAPTFSRQHAQRQRRQRRRPERPDSLGTLTLPAIPGTAYTVANYLDRAGRAVRSPCRRASVVKFHERRRSSTCRRRLAAPSARPRRRWSSPASKDDTVAGDTNNDGANSTPAAYDDWSTPPASTAGAAATLDHVHLSLRRP